MKRPVGRISRRKSLKGVENLDRFDESNNYFEDDPREIEYGRRSDTDLNSDKSQASHSRLDDLQSLILLIGYVAQTNVTTESEPETSESCSSPSCTDLISDLLRRIVSSERICATRPLYAQRLDRQARQQSSAHALCFDSIFTYTAMVSWVGAVVYRA